MAINCSRKSIITSSAASTKDDHQKWSSCRGGKVKTVFILYLFAEPIIEDRNGKDFLRVGATRREISFFWAKDREMHLSVVSSFISLIYQKRHFGGEDEQIKNDPRLVRVWCQQWLEPSIPASVTANISSPQTSSIPTWKIGKQVSREKP